MQALADELERTRDKLAATRRLAIEMLRLMTPEQYAELRGTSAFLDDLGGFTDGGC